MRDRRNSWFIPLAVVAFAVLWLGVTPVAAQSETSTILGKVTDTDGTALPGATVELSGVGAPQIFVVNAAGQFRFQHLDPGTYGLTARLDGFSPTEYSALDIRANRNYTFEIKLSSAISESITVTSSAPALDERKITQSVSIDQEQLAKIPTSRDPWSFVTQAPGVVTDRINVGGNESGQQPNFVGTGALSDQNVFMVDGVDITDLTALGASSTYFGFEQFEEMNISTGGTDVTLLTPGVQVNLITKRGTNEWRGSARYFQTDDAYQSSDNLDRGDLGPGQEDEPGALTPNQVRLIEDYGAEAGGKLIFDHLWFWGAYDRNEISQNVFGGTPDNTTLENYTGKLNAQFDDATNAVFSYNIGDKLKDGRGAGPSRAPETTWDQTGPTTIWKAQASRVFNPNFLATFTYGLVDGGFELIPKGGIDAQGTVLGPDGVFRNTFFYLDTDRNSSEYQGDASYFFNSGTTSHELKFGAQYREHENFSNYGFQGQLSIAGEIVGLPEGFDFVQLWRPQNAKNTVEYTAGWLQDTIAWDRLTVNAGVRYDLQEARNDPTVQAGASVAPNLGTVNFPGNDAGGFEWETVSPRLGATYALGEDRRTLLRASYSRFASQLGSSIPLLVNPTLYAYGNYIFQDLDGDQLVDPEETGSLIFLSPVNFDPANPNSIVSPNRIDRNFSPEITDELILGIEREVLPSFVVGARLSLRQTSDIIEDRRLIRDAAGNVRLATRDDYRLDVGGLDPSVDANGDGFIEGTLPDGSRYNVPIYRLREGLELTGGNLYTNGDRETEYRGVSLTFDRHMRDGWSLRGYANWYDWDWKIGPEFRRFDDPTNEDNKSGDPLESADDNGIVAEQSGGSGTVTPFMNSRWSVGVSGIVELPWDFHLATNIGAREGFPVPYFRTITASDGRDIDVQLVDEVDSVRTDDIYLLDLGIDREFRFGESSVTLRLDGFNLLNEGFVLQRERDAGTERVGFIDQIVGPRIFRLGAKLRFR